MNEPDTLEFTLLAQIRDEQNDLVPHSYELPAKFKNMTGTGVFGGRVNPGEIKNFHGFQKINCGRD